MATAAITKRYTPEEYLMLEREAKFKSEYKNGFITAMSGTSPDHNTIALNFASEIRAVSRRPLQGVHERRATPRHSGRTVYLP